jgi:hypothetical protein
MKNWNVYGTVLLTREYLMTINFPFRNLSAFLQWRIMSHLKSVSEQLTSFGDAAQKTTQHFIPLQHCMIYEIIH